MTTEVARYRAHWHVMHFCCGGTCHTSIFSPAGIYAIDVTLPVVIPLDSTSQTRNNTNTADNVLETE